MLFSIPHDYKIKFYYIERPKNGRFKYLWRCERLSENSLKTFTNKLKCFYVDGVKIYTSQNWCYFFFNRPEDSIMFKLLFVNDTDDLILKRDVPDNQSINYSGTFFLPPEESIWIRRLPE